MIIFDYIGGLFIPDNAKVRPTEGLCVQAGKCVHMHDGHQCEYWRCCYTYICRYI
jgi:hypothetical protein